MKNIWHALCPSDKNISEQTEAWRSKRENEQKIIEIGLCHAYFVPQNV